MIVLHFRGCDGWRETKRYKTLDTASKKAQHHLGVTPEIGGGYAVSFDGIVTLHIEGTTFAELFPATQPKPLSDEEHTAHCEDGPNECARCARISNYRADMERIADDNAYDAWNKQQLERAKAQREAEARDDSSPSIAPL